MSKLNKKSLILLLSFPKYSIDHCPNLKLPIRKLANLLSDPALTQNLDFPFVIWNIFPSKQGYSHTDGRDNQTLVKYKPPKASDIKQEKTAPAFALILP